MRKPMLREDYLVDHYANLRVPRDAIQRKSPRHKEKGVRDKHSGDGYCSRP